MSPGSAVEFWAAVPMMAPLICWLDRESQDGLNILILHRLIDDARNPGAQILSNRELLRA